jgi:hypothetical protein
LALRVRQESRRRWLYLDAVLDRSVNAVARGPLPYAARVGGIQEIWRQPCAAASDGGDPVSPQAGQWRYRGAPSSRCALQLGGALRGAQRQLVGQLIQPRGAL